MLNWKTGLIHVGLEKLIDQVKDNGTIVNERGNVINECFIGIARLSDEVRDASGYTTAYEQRFFSQVVESCFSTGASRSDMVPKSRQLIR